VKEKSDVDFLRGKADIAVVGSETLRVLERGGLAAVAPFLSALR
jgi:tryptophan synthase alpha chain